MLLLLWLGFLLFFFIRQHFSLTNLHHTDYQQIVQQKPKLKQKIFTGKFFLSIIYQASLFLIMLIIIESLALGVGTYYYLSSQLPIPTKEAMSSLPESSRIYDRHGQFLYEVHGNVKRRFVPLSEMPIYLQEATIAIEDKNFYKHPGFDIFAIMRAFIANLRHQGIAQGASTITQQLARNLFLNQEKTYLRKIKEIILAIKIEKRYNKKEILEMYLNNIPYGSIAYGASAASEIYFNKEVDELNFLEAVHLAALPKAPSDYSPFGNNKSALTKRAQLVLHAMREAKLITQPEYSYAIIQNTPNFIASPVAIRAPHFVFYVLDELKKKFSNQKIREGGLNIYTTLDLDLQKQAETIINHWGSINEKKYQANNAALVAINPNKGEILTMVGSRNYFDQQNGAFNVAISPRQPGSSFKPYVYAAAIHNGLSPDALILDNKTNFARYNHGIDYIPQNYDGKFHGAISVRRALAGSLNIPAVKVLIRAGIDRTIDLAQNLGITTLTNRQRFGPALALGGAEVKLLEHTAALGVFGNQGRRLPLTSILKITDKNQQLIYTKTIKTGQQVIDKQTAYTINDILSDAKARSFVFGPHSRLEIPHHQVAAKTGTTQDFHDAWTLGYTPSIAVGVWSGNNNNTPMKTGANGYAVSSPIWHDFMQLALQDKIAQKFIKPQTKQVLKNSPIFLNNQTKSPIITLNPANNN